MIKSLSASLAAVGTQTHLTASFVRKIASVDVTNSGGEIEVRRQLWHTKWHTPGVGACHHFGHRCRGGGGHSGRVRVVPIVVQINL